MLLNLHMIMFTAARHSFLWIRTEPKQISTAQNRATFARKVALTLKKLLEAGGYLGRRHIQNRAQTDYGVLQESLESTVVKTIPQTAMADRYCWNPYSNRRRLFEVQILVLRFGRVTIGIHTVTITDSGLGRAFLTTILSRLS